MSPSHSLSRRKRRRNRRSKHLLWIGALVLAVVFAAVAWVGIRGYLAKGELEGAMPLATRVQASAVAGQGVEASESFRELSVRAANAAELTSDPIWRIFEVLPWVGNNFSAVREIAAIINEVAQEVEPLIDVAGNVKLTDLNPVDGVVQLQPLVDAQPTISAAAIALAGADSRAASIDTADSLPLVQQASEELSSGLSKASAGMKVLDRSVQLLPAMLGASGPRNYLILFQNPAEPRSTGGIPGAVAMVHTEDGSLALTRQASSADFYKYPASVLPLPDDTLALYGEITGRYLQDVTLSPDFTLSARLAQEMWRLKFGDVPDGVISIDPVALSYLLEATGPITLPTGDVLSADNAVKLLLVDVYARYDDPGDLDSFFAAAASSVFTAVASGRADPASLVKALARAGDEHRVIIWSANETDQAILEDTTLAGQLPLSDEATKRFGVYLNDATGSKMGMYLDVSVGTGYVTCRRDGRPNFEVEVAVKNTAPADAASALPPYVTGNGAFGVTAGNIKSIISVYGAPGMDNLGVLRDGIEVGYHPTTDSGYPVSAVSLELGPGESTVLKYSWLGSEPFVGDVQGQVTPGPVNHAQQELAIACE